MVTGSIIVERPFASSCPRRANRPIKINTCRRTHRSTVCSWFTSDIIEIRWVYSLVMLRVHVNGPASISHTGIEIEIKTDPSWIVRFPFHVKTRHPRASPSSCVYLLSFVRSNTNAGQTDVCSILLSCSYSQLPMFFILGFLTCRYFMFSN